MIMAFAVHRWVCLVRPYKGPYYAEWSDEWDLNLNKSVSVSLIAGKPSGKHGPTAASSPTNGISIECTNTPSPDRMARRTAG